MRASTIPKPSHDWEQLLTEAVNTSGIISSAYHRFWNYSVGNQLLAMFECLLRGIQPGPINTFKGWLELGRHVKQGEKAITLCMPVTMKKKVKDSSRESDRDASDLSDDPDGTAKRTVFVYKPRWFVLCQTEGDPYIPTDLPQWSESHALNVLKIERVDFMHLNGNCQGFARQRQVSVSPVAVQPHTTLFHELAHVVLGHTQEMMLDDHSKTPVNIREVEAECVALICCESLNLPGIAECRGYIQHWLGRKHENGEPISRQSAQRIFRAADTILKAGQLPSTPIPAVGSPSYVAPR